MASGMGQAERRMLSAVSEGRIPHACFISCPDLAMAEMLARKAAALYCTGSADPARLAFVRDCIVPPDFKAESIRDIISELAKSSFSGGKRAVLLINAHKMAAVSQDLLLKTIEEPPGDVLFLITGSPSGLLPTVISRCAAVSCGLPSAEEVAAALVSSGASAGEAKLYAVQGVTLGRALRLWREEGFRALRRTAQDTLIGLITRGLSFENLRALSSEEGVGFMLSLMRDILICRERGVISENPDRAGEIRSIAGCVAAGRVNRIIDALAEAMERINAGASVPDSVKRGVLTRLFTEITEEF